MSETSKEYKEIIEWLFNRVPMFQNVGTEAYKPGLDGVKALSEAFGNPHKSLKTIHIGGTNGKGSVSSLIASVLQESGRKVGLFTSPHLIDFRERIRINGQMISEEGVVEFIRRFQELTLPLEPSFFELTTVMAFDWFAKNDVDVAVIEVGLGGRLDSTNIITPDLCIITNISLDHNAQLGNTLESIALEKAGIIKPSVPVIVGNACGNVRRVFEKRAEEVGSPILFASEKPIFSKAKLEGSRYVYSETPWGEIACPLTGDCQPENASTVMTALSQIGFSDATAVRKGFENVCHNTGLTGRWTTLREHPRLICDTGHNAGGWKWLGQRLRIMADELQTIGRQLHIVAGFVNDKDVSAILEEMPVNARFYWATPSVRRGRDSNDLRQLAQTKGLSGEAFKSVDAAVDAAIEAASRDETIFVGGSTFVVADLLTALSKKEV